MEYEKNWDEGFNEPNPQERKFEPVNNEDNETENSSSQKAPDVEWDSKTDATWKAENMDTDNPIVNPAEFDEANYNDSDSNNNSNPDSLRDYDDIRITQSLTHEDLIEDVDYEDVTDVQTQDYEEENRSRIQDPNDFVDFENKDSKTLNSSDLQDPDYRNTDGLNKLSNPDADEISDGDYVDPIVNRNDDPYRTPGL